MSSYYMVVPTADQYRWLGRTSESSTSPLVKVREAPIIKHWRPVEVRWVPETKERRECDFPIFHPVVRGISQHAAECLSSFLKDTAELLPLRGLANRYFGLHCTNWIDAAIVDGNDRLNGTVYSTLFVPKVKSAAIGKPIFFGLKGFVTKMFVDEKFRRAVESNGLTGIEFYDVELL